MIFDCILYNGESDLLEARAEHLRGVVDAHIVVQGTVTFTGHPRAVAPVDIPHVYSCTVETDPALKTPWERETHQRNACVDALRTVGAKADDMVLLADVDEFPVPDVLRSIKPVALNTQSLVYFLNGWQKDGYGLSSVFMPFGLIEELGAKVARDQRYGIGNFGGKEAQHAGFHFTYQGGAEAVRRKIRSFSHQEQNIPDVIAPGVLEERMERGLWVQQAMDEKPTITYIPLDSFAPQAILALAERRPGWVHEGAAVR